MFKTSVEKLMTYGLAYILSIIESPTLATVGAPHVPPPSANAPAVLQQLADLLTAAVPALQQI